MQILNCKIWGIQVNKIMKDFNPRVEKTLSDRLEDFAGMVIKMVERMEKSNKPATGF